MNSKVIFTAKTQVDVREECVWLRIPAETGQRFQPKLDSDSGANWTLIPAETGLHDARYLGSNYRERQTVKRRQERLQDRIGRMSPVERHELLVWLNRTYGETGERA